MKVRSILYNTILLSTLLAASSCESEDPEDDSVILSKLTVEVVEYVPAPGQFVNVFPACAEGESYSTVLGRATRALNSDQIVTLGSFGGYVVVKTSKPVTGLFQVAGNAFHLAAEPGIVQISQDGETWYTIAGEHYHTSPQISVTYSRPAAGYTDETYIPYVTSDGKSGYVARIPEYHTQEYFPLWDNNSVSVTFSGHRLPDNGELNAATGQYELKSYVGYADSYPNTSPYSYLDPADAVDENMKPVSIGPFSYIKVYTGVLQSNGILGECSTEVTGFYAVEK